MSVDRLPTSEPFENLPISVQEDIYNTLMAYDEVYVWYEDGKYRTDVGVSIKSSYADDHRFIGEYKAEEIYTEEERIVNYANVFKSYPSFYKGPKDYSIFKIDDNSKEYYLENNELKIRDADNKNLVIGLAVYFDANKIYYMDANDYTARDGSLIFSRVSSLCADSETDLLINLQKNYLTGDLIQYVPITATGINDLLNKDGKDTFEYNFAVDEEGKLINGFEKMINYITVNYYGYDVNEDTLNRNYWDVITGNALIVKSDRSKGISMPLHISELEAFANAFDYELEYITMSKYKEMTRDFYNKTIQNTMKKCDEDIER